MNLGLPEHLARESMSRAIAHAGHCAALVCLVIGMVVAGDAALAAVGSAPAGGGRVDLAAVVLLGVQAILLLFVARLPTVTLTVVYLVAGAAVVFGVTILVMTPGDVESTNTTFLALPQLALVLVGGAGAGSLIALAWAALAYGLGEAAAFLGAAVTGDTWTPNAATAAAFGLLVVVRLFDGFSRRADTRRETGLHRASQQTRELALRHDYELRATARLHDTALSHLVSIAAAGSGPIDERLRSGIRQDLGLIVGRDWAIDHGDARIDDDVHATGGTSAAARHSPAVQATRAVLPEALDAAHNAGLSVRLTGDPAVLASLGPARASALDSAVAQCLVNVARHAGVHEAEVAIGPGHGDVTVVVIDSGLGFDLDAVPDDRIGLRTSIRARIEQEGGSVRIWSSPGVGTTVVLTVPEGGE